MNEQLTLEMLIEQIQSGDHNVRAAARDNAGQVGAPAIAPLAKIACDPHPEKFEIARAANRAMQNIVYHAGRPGASEEATAVSAELIKLVGAEPPLQFRRDVMWMIWQIAGPEAVGPVAALLGNAELRDDARMCLEGLPADAAVAALRAGLNAAPDDFKPAMAHSLRKRGVEVSGVPDLRLVPTKETSVTPVGR